MKQIILDIETTGINPKNDRIIEIAFIELNDWKIESEFSTLINPNVKIPEKAYKIHNISEKMLIDAPSFEKISDFLREKLSNSTIFGYKCLKFDLKFINYELLRANKIPIFPNVFDLSLLNEFFKTKSLYQIAKKLKIDIKKRHRALIDAQITLKILRWIIENFSENFIKGYILKYEDKLKLLTELTNNKIISKIIYRGKYKISEHIGFPIEISQNYIIFYNTLHNKLYKLYLNKIIRIESE
ncbi:MAG: 3'-5' exonuclease [candidate division WOR-3 bacterium]|jgi:DNA polymerase III epsilon subunit family exonuclease